MEKWRVFVLLPDSNLSKQHWMRSEQQEPSATSGQHSWLSGYKGGAYLAKEESFSFRDVLPWPLPFALKASKNHLSSPDEPLQIF